MSKIQSEIVSENIIYNQSRDDQAIFHITHSTGTTKVNTENFTCKKCNKIVQNSPKGTLHREVTSVNDSSKFIKRREGNKKSKMNSKKSQTQGKYKHILTYENRNEIITKLGAIVTNIQEIVELL